MRTLVGIGGRFTAKAGKGYFGSQIAGPLKGEQVRAVS